MFLSFVRLSFNDSYGIFFLAFGDQTTTSTWYCISAFSCTSWRIFRNGKSSTGISIKTSAKVEAKAMFPKGRSTFLALVIAEDTGQTPDIHHEMPISQRRGQVRWQSRRKTSLLPILRAMLCSPSTKPRHYHEDAARCRAPCLVPVWMETVWSLHCTVNSNIFFR